jgi:cell division protein FtsQ
MSLVDIDPRLDARRRQVAEARARSSFTKVIWVLALTALIGSGVLVARSPLLAVQNLVVEGMARSEVDAILSRSGLIEGRPMVLVRTAEVEAALAADPRVKSVAVRLDWPQTARVLLERRVPVAWAPVDNQWGLIALDGVVVGMADVPTLDLPHLQVPITSERSAAVIGGLAFLAELAPQPGIAVVVTESDGELWADIAGTAVRLGRPIDMEPKARALVALLAEGLPSGAMVNLVAPTRPAVTPPTG